MKGIGLQYKLTEGEFRKELYFFSTFALQLSIIKICVEFQKIFKRFINDLKHIFIFTFLLFYLGNTYHLSFLRSGW